MKEKIVIIGAGFSGISAAAHLKKKGFEVHVFEKHASAGGRARQLKTADGFVFDMGPSWYWMPDVFETFFSSFERKASDFYSLKLLDPGFELIFGKDDYLAIPYDFETLCAQFEAIEQGAARQLKKFMREAGKKYEVSMNDIVYKPSLTIKEFLTSNVIKGSFGVDVFTPFSKHVRKYFSNPKLLALMEFPLLFLGAKPTDIPAMYSLMNYAGLKLGTWYPEGGFGNVVEGMKRLAEEMGVIFHYNKEVQRILTTHHRVTGIALEDENVPCDGLVAAADYPFVEQNLLPAEYRNYDERYWERKTVAPSALLFFLGVNKRLERLHHHTLFFDTNMEQHAREIYDHPRWPSDPLFYACCPSRSDESVAPRGHENLFLLMPIAPGLIDTPELREKYYSILMKRLGDFALTDVASAVVFKESYCIENFKKDYNAYKGNAYGLANTLKQTAILKPKIINKKLKNMVYTGQFTVPGPGVPPSIISGKIAADQLQKQLERVKYEVTV